MTKGARPGRTWSIKSRDGVAQGSCQPRVTVQIVASLGLAALGQVPTLVQSAVAKGHVA